MKRFTSRSFALATVLVGSTIVVGSTVVQAQRNDAQRQDRDGTRSVVREDDKVRAAAERALAAHAAYAASINDAHAIGPSAARIRITSPAGAAHYVSYGFLPGERVVDTRYADIDGKALSLHAAGAGAKGTVVIIRDAECPVSQRYSPRIAELERSYAARGWQFVHVDVTPHNAAEARADLQKYGLTGRLVLDSTKRMVGALRAASSAEAFVIDTKGTLRYRGSIDDQYGIGFHKDKATNTWLIDALDRVATNRDVAVPHTDASGCMFDVDFDMRGADRAITYNNRVSRIIQNKCESCHRVDGLAPMPLQTYKQVYDRKAVIAYMVESRRMPPWGARKGVGEWANDASLNDRDLADLLKWAKGAAPQGVATEAPIARRYAAGWAMGKPDAVVQIPDTFRIPAQGVVEYKYSYVKTNFATDKWITSMEIKPTAPKVVHHVLVFIEEPGRKAPNDPSRKPGEPLPSGGIDGFFAATAPGAPATVFPLGAAKKLPKGAWLKFQIHYQPNGVEQVDQTQLGFMFADDSITASRQLLEVESRSAFNVRFAIPPHADNHEVTAQHIFRRPGTLITLFPHTHLRGKAWKIELQKADGTKELLLDVPRYDFNWQTFYEFRKPIHVDSGMRVIATAWYDNSKNNPFNPDPSATVRFGEQTFEEMMIGYFDWIPDPRPAPARSNTSNAPAKPSSNPPKQ